MSVNIKSNCSVLAIGCVLYDSITLLPVPDGIYSDFVNTYTVSGGSGVISTVGVNACSAPNANVSQNNAILACTLSGGWSGNVSFDGGTSTLCSCTTVYILNNLAAFNLEVGTNQTFYLSDGSNVRQFQRSSSSYFGTQIAACVAC